MKENDKDTEKYFETNHGLKILCDKFIEDIKDEWNIWFNSMLRRSS